VYLTGRFLPAVPLHAAASFFGGHHPNVWGLLQGASFLPYLITDGIVAPESCRHCYSENLALMPNCYFVNDYKHAHMVGL
jgi:hypothetical protein